MQNDPTITKASEAEVKKAVKDRYGGLARSEVSQWEGTQQIAQAFGYDAEQLASIPTEANLGVSCGNPTAMASLQPGEVVLDLGSGAGLDAFLAAQKVAPDGKSIGIDMTEEMIQRARRNAEQSGLKNVEFHLAEIQSLPLPDESVDCAISNCVINLVPDKAVAFAEIFRVLKPGGRLAISDLALKEELPPVLSADISAYVGCIAGAMPIRDYEISLTAAGFAEVQIVDSGVDLNAYAKLDKSGSCCGSGNGCDSLSGETSVHQGLADLLQRFDINQHVASVKVFALKSNG